MKATTTIVIGLLAGLGLFASACASGADEAGDEAATEPTEERSEQLCCIEYTCPTDGESFTGCKPGPNGSINAAFNACKNYCGRTCTSSGLICD